MDAPVQLPGSVRPTQAAEGLPRRAFTVAEVERMVECGIMREDERVELIGGELVPMSPKGIRHEVLKRALVQRWARIEGIHVLVETTLRLSDDTFVEPDLVLIDATQPTFELKATDCLLAVELADSSLAYDLGRKPPLYAAAGLRELWVVNARDMTATLLLGPDGSTFSSVRQYGPADVLRPTLVPDAAISLGSLDLR
jgi:Uma2 family endonuclease